MVQQTLIEQDLLLPMQVAVEVLVTVDQVVLEDPVVVDVEEMMSLQQPEAQILEVAVVLISQAMVKQVDQELLLSDMQYKEI